MDDRPQVLREGRAVPEVQRLPLRRLQEGVVLHQPGRLQDRARDLRRRRAHDPGGQGRRQPRSRSRRWRRRRRRTSSRRTPTSAAPTRRGSSSSEGRRRLRAEDDGAARRALLGAGQVRRLDARLQADHRQQHGRARASASGRTRSCATRCRAGTTRRRSRRSSAWAPSTTRSADEGPRRTRRRSAATPSTTRRRSWRSSGTRKRRRRRTADTYELDKFVYKVFLDHFPEDKDAYEMSFYYGELLWTLRALEGRRRAVHEGRRDEARAAST